MVTISRIHHYTSVDTLGLILASKRIRFNRVDRVDDLTESQRHAQIAFGSYFFVSCWTYDNEESVPQWHMYTDRMRGVRISLPVRPFKAEPLVAPARFESIGSIPSPLAFNELFGENYLVVPTCLDPAQFGGPVEYTNDVEARYEQAVVLSAKGAEVIGEIRRPFDLVRLKTTEWAFQKEYRFALFILPSPPGGIDSPHFVERLPNYVVTALAQKVATPLTHFDVALADEALNSLEVTVGPLCPPGLRLAVDALVEKYVPGAQVRESTFAGRLRPK